MLFNGKPGPDAASEPVSPTSAAASEPARQPEPAKAVEPNIRVAVDIERFWEPDFNQVGVEIVEPEEKPAPQPVQPPREPPLPGPYCEPGVDSSFGRNRYLVLGGTRVCTAHVTGTSALYISHDRLRRIVDTTSAAKLEKWEYMNAGGHLWILLSEGAMAKFNLRLVGVDRTHIHLARR